MTKPVLSRKALLVAGGLAHYLRPMLAEDAAIDLPSMLKGVTGKNYKDELPKVAKAITVALDGKLAKDASLADIGKVMDEMSAVPVEEGVDADPSTGLPMNAEEMKKKTMDATGADPCAAIVQLLTGKVAPEIIEQVCAAIKGGTAAAVPPPAADEEDEEEKKRKEKEGAMDKRLEGMVTKDEAAKLVKGAEDSAIKKVTERLNGIAEARAFVRPWVGELAIACDSATDVFNGALKVLGKDELAKDVTDVNALRAIVASQAVPGARKSETPMAADAAIAKTYAERFPEAAHIGNIG